MLWDMPDAAVMLREFDVTPSFQFAKTYCVYGLPCGETAVTVQAVPLVQVTFAGAVYVPAGQPVPDTENSAVTFAPIATATGAAEKLAVMVEGAAMENVSGFAALATVPLHPVN
jgi:hypothetical protein